jgi:tol-pal system protein YbgF
MVLLQDEIRTLRAMQARSDTMRRASADSTRAVADSTLHVMARANDSLRALALRFGAFQANVAGELFEIGKQLITLQELTGQSSRHIMNLRSAMEERAQAIAGSDTGGAPVQPGPAQMYTAAFDQLRRGAFGTARTGFEELLRRYPDFEQASAAQLHIGQTYELENRTAEADSVYGLVVARYPKSVDAPTALYKYGLSRLKQGRAAEAREALQRVIRDWPRSTEAELAADRLKTIK